MKKITIIVTDAVAADVLATVTANPLEGLTVETVQAAAIEQLASFIELVGERLQASGKRNANLVAGEIAGAVRAGDHLAAQP